MLEKLVSLLGKCPNLAFLLRLCSKPELGRQEGVPVSLL